MAAPFNVPGKKDSKFKSDSVGDEKAVLISNLMRCSIFEMTGKKDGCINSVSVTEMGDYKCINRLIILGWILFMLGDYYNLFFDRTILTFVIISNYFLAVLQVGTAFSPSFANLS